MTGRGEHFDGDWSQTALVIGAGPAGLMAAEMLARSGQKVVLAEAMPSPARKFLMAGKSGLNLTKSEPAPSFARHIHAKDSASGPDLRGMVRDFGPQEVMDWANGLGIDLFTGSSGRVFPVGMKASPLLRAWLLRLDGLGVTLCRRWRWCGFADAGAPPSGDKGADLTAGFCFDTPQGPVTAWPRVAVLALGGASWPRLGSDGAWAGWLSQKGVEVAPFAPSNMGFHVHWSPAMVRHFGAAVKGCAIKIKDSPLPPSRGEWVITARGIEGGGIYPLSAALRDGAQAVIDLAPDLDTGTLAKRFPARAKLSLGNWLKRGLGDPVKVALALEWGRPWPEGAEGWAARAKSLPLHHNGPFDIERAISTAGGVRCRALDAELGLKALPGVFVAGEMIDWDAPTGGYLLTTCLATGRVAGYAAARYAGKTVDV